jgi:hypothetical protein
VFLPSADRAWKFVHHGVAVRRARRRGRFEERAWQLGAGKRRPRSAFRSFGTGLHAVALTVSDMGLRIPASEPCIRFGRPTSPCLTRPLSRSLSPDRTVPNASERAAPHLQGSNP